MASSAIGASRPVFGLSLSGIPEEGERDPDQEGSRPSVGAVEDAVRIRRVEQERHQQARRDRSGDHPDQQATMAEAGHAGREGERPEQVELLLDRQRPEVAEQRRARELLEVGLVAEDQVPVGDVGH